MTMELGGNITLAGFGERDFAEIIVIKKIVGQYARKLSDHVPGFTHLKVTLKEVHGTSVEIHGHASVGGKEIAAESTSHNLFMALDDALKRLLEQAQKEHATA